MEQKQNGQNEIPSVYFFGPISKISVQAYLTSFPARFPSRGSFFSSGILRTGLLIPTRCVFNLLKGGQHDTRKFEQIASYSILNRINGHVDCRASGHSPHNRRATVTILLNASR